MGNELMKVDMYAIIKPCNIVGIEESSITIKKGQNTLLRFPLAEGVYREEIQQFLENETKIKIYRLRGNLITEDDYVFGIVGETNNFISNDAEFNGADVYIDTRIIFSKYRQNKN